MILSKLKVLYHRHSILTIHIYNSVHVCDFEQKHVQIVKLEHILLRRICQICVWMSSSKDSQTLWDDVAYHNLPAYTN